MNCIFLRASNTDVTDFYINIIYKAILKKGITISEYSKYNAKQKDCIIFTPTIMEAFREMCYRHKEVIIWIQGILPEESYLKHKSKLRKFILEIIEKFTLKRAKFLFFVSNEMKEHFESKYKINFDNRFYIMPCFNTFINKDCFYKIDKYIENTFAYVGSLSPWQCFEDTAKLYKRIEENMSSKLFIFTQEQKKADNIMKQYKIKNYEIKYVPNNLLHKELAGIKYGFILRDNNIVNQVATPTKLSTYLANGVIPIFSSCLKSFAKVTENCKNVIKVNDKNDVFSILAHAKEQINQDDIYIEYETIFNSYYNSELHSENISKHNKFNY